MSSLLFQFSPSSLVLHLQIIKNHALMDNAAAGSAENKLAAFIGKGPDSIKPVSGLESIDSRPCPVPLIIIAAVSMDAVMALSLAH